MYIFRYQKFIKKIMFISTRCIFSCLQLGDLSNPELRILTDQLDKIRYGGEMNKYFKIICRK